MSFTSMALIRVKMHNYYALLYNKAVFEAPEEDLGKGNAVLFARSATAGASSSQFTGEEIVLLLIHPWRKACGVDFPFVFRGLVSGAMI